MAVQAIEAPSAPVYSVQVDDKPPSPLYTDEFLTVYSIPIYPTPSIAEEDSEVADPMMASSSEPADRPLKRKRTPSPFEPARQKSPPATDHTVDTASPVEKTFLQRAQSPNFTPTSLVGDEAQEWRKLLLQEMFPMQPPKQDSAEPKDAKGKEKGKAQEKARVAQVFAKKTLTTGRDEDTEGPLKPLIGNHARYSRLPPVVEGSDAHTQPALPTLAYLLVGPSVRGKFDAKKAKELGVPLGPIRGRLTRGETITFEVDDGAGGKIERTVKPEDCVAPSEVAQAVLIVDVPSPAYIPSLMASFTESPFFSKYRSRTAEGRKEHPTHAVFHLCGEGVLEDERYKAFMNGFSDETYHIVSSRQHTPDTTVFGRSALVQAKLNQLDADMFPLTKYSLEPAQDFSLMTGLPPKTTLSRRNLMVHVRPLRPPIVDDKGHEDEFGSLAASGSLPELSDNVRQTFAEIKESVGTRVACKSPRAQPGDDVVVTPLGTGSAIPTRLRNVSGTLIQIPGHGAVLLDCGEGTWGQLARSFGNDPARTSGVWAVLRDLKCIYLSHMHGDHHMGLSRILQMRTLMRPPPSEPLYVVGHRQHLMYLTERQELEDLGLADPNGVVMVLSDSLNWRPARQYARIQPQDEPFMSDGMCAPSVA
ncbi:Zinc phosphodiesterase ELAC protein 2 [Trametes pubescens]|uniref:ribonuclease Z n=1 Tax=Trametes pubescens TaxID=154538 RepID=A0A1M2V2D4_TRAPU|nr:Zinc phosphodiesterase ELAC protein 2 [Trametes pubescens]